MNRLSDNKLINIPFRMLNLNILHQNNNFDVNGNIALEYRNRKDTDFMELNNRFNNFFGSRICMKLLNLDRTSK